MRNNQPVTAQETIIPDGVFIYSRTDLNGQIVEANKAFAEISGFQQEEMIGEPHNLVRHPDMPEEAYSDMWRSLKAGKPWKGMVKNRRKDGGYYWVYAMVSPVREEDKVVGYQSVRTKPSRQQIEDADAIYRRLKQGDKSISIAGGRALRNRSKLVEIALNPVFQVNATICLGVLTLLLGVASTGLDMPWSTALFQVLAGSTLFASGYLLLWALPRFFRRVSNIKGFLEALLRSGNLCTQLTSSQNDALGEIEALLDMQVSATRSIVQIMQDSAKNVNDTTNTLNSSVVSLTGSASQQTEKTNAAAATIEELISSIGLIAQQAAEIESASKEVGIRSAEGAQLSDKASETIKALSQTVTSSAEMVEQLGRRAEEIGKVAGVIKEIADQTNLLALNAAIEAARAGESGRGFAVVADEVRKLAERTAKATQEIGKMITHIQLDTTDSVAGMRQSAEQVGMSVELVAEAHKVLASNSHQIYQAVTMVSEITHATYEQKSAMDLMGQSIEAVARLTEDNLNVARDTEVASARVQRNVDRMSKAVAQYAA